MRRSAPRLRLGLWPVTDIGYLRVSSSGQTLTQQRDVLLASGIKPEHIFEDTASGMRSDRPGLAAAMHYAREGDRLAVVRLDRLGRNALHGMKIMRELRERGVAVWSITQGIDLSTSAGQMMADLLLVVAEWERSVQRERVAEARAAVEKRGGKWGRKAVLTPAQVQMARTLRAAGQAPNDIAAQLGCSRSTLYRVTADLQASA